MIQKLIDEALAKEQEGRKDRVRSGKWSPSSLGKCFRAQYWNRKNEPVSNPPDARALRLFKCGILFHDYVQQFLPEHQVEVEVETPNLYGFADIVTDDAVYDIKSVHSGKFWHMSKTDYNVNEKELPKILQVVAYAMVLKKPKAVICFISKDDLCIEEYTFKTAEWESKVTSEVAQLELFWKADALPPGKPRCYWNAKKNMFLECSYCNFRDKCAEVGDGYE